MTENKTTQKTVLVIDDDADCRRFAHDVLTDDYDVTTVATADDGMRIARERSPDAIVLDVMMPGGKDGFSTLSDLRADPATSKIPIVMLSEVNTIMDMDVSCANLEQFTGAAPSAFLEKPVEPQVLKDAVRKAIEEAGSDVQQA